jgi:hypothetical protein
MAAKPIHIPIQPSADNNDDVKESMFGNDKDNHTQQQPEHGHHPPSSSPIQPLLSPNNAPPPSSHPTGSSTLLLLQSQHRQIGTGITMGEQQSRQVRCFRRGPSRMTTKNFEEIREQLNTAKCGAESSLPTAPKMQLEQGKDSNQPRTTTKPEQGRDSKQSRAATKLQSQSKQGQCQRLSRKSKRIAQRQKKREKQKELTCEEQQDKFFEITSHCCVNFYKNILFHQYGFRVNPSLPIWANIQNNLLQ